MKVCVVQPAYSTEYEKSDLCFADQLVLMDRRDEIMPYPRVCAHRGFNTVAPENSLAVENGARTLGAGKNKEEAADFVFLEGDGGVGILAVCYKTLFRTWTRRRLIISPHPSPIGNAEKLRKTQKEYL